MVIFSFFKLILPVAAVNGMSLYSQEPIVNVPRVLIDFVSLILPLPSS